MDIDLSYANATNSRQYVYKTHMQMLTQWAQSFPEKEAFVEYDANAKRHSITCQELLEKSKEFGWYVASIGIRKGDTVAFCMKNSLNMLISMFGVQFAGGIPISTMQSMADGSDVIDTICDHNSKLLVMDATEGDQSWKMFENVQSSEDTSLLGIIYNNRSTELFHHNFEENATHVVNLTNTPEVQLPDLYPEDIAVYFKTSGSTGKPKLVGHSHFGFFNSTYSINDCLGIDSKSRFFCDRPFGWGVGSPRTFLASGATRVFVDSFLSMQQNNIDLLSDIIHQEKCTHVYLPGYLISDLIKSQGNDAKFSSVRAIKCSGERFPKRYTELLGRFCKELVIWYGSTEAAGVSAFSSQNSEEYEDGIIGKPLPGIEMKLTGENGNVVPMGQNGELHVRSVYRFLEYKNMREKFLDTVDNGNWLQTGDLAHIRADGNFVLVGRTCDQMSVGSMKIFPQEVEKVLLNCPEVDAVIVVPVPDERLHHAICACIVLSKTKTADTDNMHEYFAHLWADNALFKPKYYMSFEKLPANASGKTDRKMIAKMAASELNLC
ncbi:3-[(3aS,4S,7aS)-7a-methyl-1,5-dioxo-octahydro-1H-inden-4-yl]propanoyl:CoA ligase-like [Mercenaria mercenaria]|uniref:3-[(3aS,4S,7aS)-7a-methyl-1, 5-dioxo-octahydro-1H-inden-4-yl]propanoyl:CoA ligase-like n=1 Tax=Mercenaria mercenaria TaxID=6596 RepID=UPI00234E6B1A|nr:3-[(3aS,4S,7aS)-7a-methyl-1,5-dioxo-octahydro-1H-inden-4-yl]propanoyl:CoA ligase-like [Mercenaria mercenaria]